VSLTPLLSNLWSLYLQQRQLGVQHHKDGRGHERVQLEGLEGYKDGQCLTRIEPRPSPLLD